MIRYWVRIETDPAIVFYREQDTTVYGGLAYPLLANISPIRGPLGGENANAIITLINARGQAGDVLNPPPLLRVATIFADYGGGVETLLAGTVQQVELGGQARISIEA